MAVSYLYNDTNVTLDNIYLATSGGTSFGSNLAGSATMDYFDDASVVDDAIYFGDAYPFSDLLFDVGTQLVADDITVVWEYYHADNEDWEEMEQCTDNTNAFQTAGANTVVFPLQKYNYDKTTVNSVSKYWVRVRISAVTNLTEGGANQNTAVYAKDGWITFSGSSVEDKANLADLYTWMDANHPEVEMKVVGNQSAIYILPRASIRVDSDQYFEMNSEILELEHPFIRMRNTSLIYQYNWYLTDSYLYFDGYEYNNYFVFTSGCTWVRSTLYSVNNVRIHSGTYTVCNFVGGQLRSLQGSVDMNRCSIGRFLILGDLTDAEFDTCEFREDNVVLVYDNEFHSQKTIWSYSGYKLSVNLVFDTHSPTYTTTDNITPFDDIDQSTGAISRYIAVTANPSKCYFYDDSEGTYTDYTSEAGDATEDDVPLYGDVGDCLYFGHTNTFLSWSHGRGQGADFTIGEANTDYTYAYEWYNGAEWEELPCSQSLLTAWGDYKGYDATYNFSENGKWLFRIQSGNGSTAVNGDTAYWHRIRIVSKGTGTPSLSEITLSAETGIAFWHLYDQYTLGMLVIDKDGDAISGVTVLIMDSNDAEKFSGSTDENGTIADQVLVNCDYYFDPFNLNNYKTHEEVVQKPITHTITISKPGYITQTHKITMDEKKDLVFTLLEGPPTATTMAAMEVAPNLYQQIK